MADTTTIAERFSKMTKEGKLKNLEKMTIAQLKAILQDAGRGGFSKYKKAELQSMICRCFSLDKDKDPGIWRGYGYQDMSQRHLIEEAKKLNIPYCTRMGKEELEREIDKAEIAPLKEH